jgi:hypothetical protein
VYGGGIGRFGAPVFFLAERLHETVQEGLTVVHAGLEFARGIVAPPATSRDGRIVVRTDAMRRWLWTRVEAGPHRGRAGELAALLAACGTTTAQAIERLVADQADTLVLHELGEVRAGALLGPDWERMLLALDDRRAESVARAVRDLLADCLVTLPALVERRETVALRFWFANLEGLRRSLALRLAALATRRELDLHAILDASAAEHTHHRDTALGLLESWRAGGAPAVGQTVDALLANAQAA